MIRERDGARCLLSAALLMLACVGCAAQTGTGSTMKTSSITVKSLGNGLWQVSVIAQHKGVEKTGAVTILSQATPDGATPPHAGLAASTAWFQLGSAYLNAGAAADAAYCFRQGLDALGERYATLDVVDDTDQKIAAAEELLAKGREVDGAGLLQRMLATRHALYRVRYAGDLR